MQINLSEYRNRARKPAERRSSAEKSSPPHSSVSAAPLFPTLLSAPPPLLSSSYSGSLMLGTMGTLPSSGPPPVPGGVSAPSVPQFEPVSPDDGDQTPPLINMEGACLFSLVPIPHPLMWCWWLLSTCLVSILNEPMKTAPHHAVLSASQSNNATS